MLHCRDPSFKPKILPEGQKDIFELTRKVIVFWAMGVSTRDAMATIKEFYGSSMDPLVKELMK